MARQAKPKPPKRFKLNSVQMISLSGLKARGWSQRLVDTVLGEPHALVDNPHYKCAAPMRLYYRAHVERLEQLPEVQASIERSLNQSASTKRANIVRREAEEVEQHRRAIERARAEEAREEKRARAEAELFDNIWETPINVAVLDRWELEDMAVQYYAKWYRKGRAVHANSLPKQALDTIVLEYIELHLLVWRQNKSVELSRKRAKDWYRIMGARICEAIASSYPHLSDFCRRQALTEFGVVKRPQAN
jgi:hypothetical protein